MKVFGEIDFVIESIWITVTGIALWDKGAIPALFCERYRSGGMLIESFSNIKIRSFLIVVGFGYLTYIVLDVCMRQYSGERLRNILPVLSWVHLVCLIWFLIMVYGQGKWPLFGDYNNLSFIGISIVSFAMSLLLLGIGWVLYKTLFKDNVGGMLLLNKSVTLDDFSFLKWRHVRLVILTPFAEEVIYRGYLLSRLSSKIGSSRALVLISIMFGFLHTDVLGKIVAGLVFGVIFLKSKCILAPILCHAIVNALLICFFYLVICIRWIHDSLGLVPSPLFLGCLLVVPTGAYIFIFLRRNWPRGKTEEIVVS